MGTDTLACLSHAWRLLLRRTELWWPAAVVDAALWIITLGWVKALLLASGGSGVSWVLTGWLLTAVVWAAWDAARWFAVDRALRGDAGGLVSAWVGLRRRGPQWISGSLLLGLAQAVVAVAGLVAFLHLLAAGEWSRLLAPVGMVDGWRERGPLWLLGGVAVVAGLGALRTVLHWAAQWWRIALLVETPRPRQAMAAAVRFVARQRWAMVGRGLSRQAIGAVVWLAPWVTVGLLVDLMHRLSWELRTPVLLFWVCTTAAGWALARAWLGLADLITWRRRGGADGDAELLTWPVCVDRRRMPRGPDAPRESRLASEPTAISRHAPGRLASEPGEVGLLFDEG